MTTPNTAPKAAPDASTVAVPVAVPAPRTSRRGSKQRSAIDRINDKLIQAGAFGRKWETVFADGATATGATDIAKASSKAVADKLSALIAAADGASKFLENLKAAGWKVPAGRGKSDLRVNDIVDLKPRYVDDVVKAGAFKKQALRGLVVLRAVGGFVTVSGNLAKETKDEPAFSGTYRANWFIRAIATKK